MAKVYQTAQLQVDTVTSGNLKTWATLNQNCLHGNLQPEVNKKILF